MEYVHIQSLISNRDSRLAIIERGEDDDYRLHLEGGSTDSDDLHFSRHFDAAQAGLRFVIQD